jgi:ubiquinone/menaquinone biosynthesis C-methylase UbiE
MNPANAFTERLLVTAGLAPGMRVLDLGCGTGDVSLLAAKLVGPAGAVVGVDRDPRAIEEARRRAPGPNISFLEAPIDRIDLPAESFDAIVARRVPPPSG